MKKLSESVWGEIRKKSLGQEERKEESVNSMSKDEFADYLREIYEYIPDAGVSTNSLSAMEPDFIMNPRNKTNIYVNVYECDINSTDVICTLDIGPYKMNSIGLPSRLEIHISDIFTDELKDRLSMKYRTHRETGLRDLNNPFRIEPADYMVKESNKFFIEVLDFLIDNHDETHKPLIRRK